MQEPSRTRIKICGITRPEDARLAAAAGADAIGIVFYADSPRAVDAVRAREIVAAVPPFVTTVALFLDAGEAEVRNVLDAVAVDLLQFHGRETPAFCDGFGRRYIKALGMAGIDDPEPLFARYPGCSGFLLDSHGLGAAGGTGETFDWARFPAAGDHPLVLAGGLTPDNVAQAVRRTRPWGVDVGSGVESAPGIKDAAKLRAFIEEVHRVQRD